MIIIGIGRQTIVYMYTSPSKKKYIGIAYSNRESKRKTDHKYTASKGKGYRFHDAIRKYGFDLLDYKVICVCFDREEAERIEELLIKEYDTTNPKYGYNIQHGGIGCSSKETHEKISKALTGRKVSEETKKKIAEHNRNMPIERRKKIADTLGKKIIKMDLDGNFICEYNSIKEAKKHNDNAKVWNCCNGIQKQSKGYKYKYKELI